MIAAITGANGFVGSHLLRDQLSRGRRVRGIDLNLSRLQGIADHPRVELILSDIRDRERMAAALEGAQIVFHLAAAHLSTRANEVLYKEVNCDASRMLVELSRSAGVQRFIHCSSVGVYGRIQEPPADETTACLPKLVYERTKLEGEQSVKKFAEDTGFPVVILRPVWVYGPDCPRTKKLFNSIRRRRFVFLGKGDRFRHCIFVADLVRAFDLSAKHPNAPGKTFVVGDQEAVTVRQLVNAIADTIGVPRPRLRAPRVFGFIAFTAAEIIFSILGRESPVSRRSLAFFENNTSFNTGYVKQELGFASQITLREGLKECYAAILQESSGAPAPDPLIPEAESLKRR